MSIRYEWVNEEKIIAHIYVEAPWTWQDFNAVTAILMPIIRDLKHPCATVVDVTKMGALPKDGNVIRSLMNIEKSMPDNIFASAVVGAPFGVMVFMNMLLKISPHAKRIALFTQTIEEAHERIMAQYHDPDQSTKTDDASNQINSSLG